MGWLRPVLIAAALAVWCGAAAADPDYRVLVAKKKSKSVKKGKKKVAACELHFRREPGLPFFKPSTGVWNVGFEARCEKLLDLDSECVLTVETACKALPAEPYYANNNPGCAKAVAPEALCTDGADGAAEMVDALGAGCPVGATATRAGVDLDERTGTVTAVDAAGRHLRFEHTACGLLDRAAFLSYYDRELERLTDKEARRSLLCIAAALEQARDKPVYRKASGMPCRVALQIGVRDPNYPDESQRCSYFTC